MLHEPIQADADPLDDEIVRALDDAGPDIDQLRNVTRRMVDLPQDSHGYRLEASWANELLARIDARARRVELAEGELTADGLLQFANVRDRTTARVSQTRRPNMARTLHEDYLQALEGEASAIRAQTAATVAVAEAQRRRRGAEEAYRAHGASQLVR